MKKNTKQAKQNIKFASLCAITCVFAVLALYSFNYYLKTAQKGYDIDTYSAECKENAELESSDCVNHKLSIDIANDIRNHTWLPFNSTIAVIGILLILSYKKS